ncbi:MAG: hypothetical protein O2782_23710 [bacterium]|nr:hypothetical protein [bacterium]
MRYRFCHRPLSMLMLLGAVATTASAQDLADLLSRSLPEEAPTLTAEHLLETALQQDKTRGRLDSAVVGYRQVVTLYRRGQGRAETARRAQARLDWLRASGLLPDAEADTDVAMVDRRPARVRQTATVGQLLSATRVLQLGRAAPVDSNTPGVSLAARGRWLERLALVRQSGGDRTQSNAPQALVAIGAAVDAVRRLLGLEGLLPFVEQERRRSRRRPLWAHEQYLAALQNEKEYKDFGSALEGYRNVVQLSRTGGFATRLIERARQGVGRCAEWQQMTHAGS